MKKTNQQYKILDETANRDNIIKEAYFISDYIKEVLCEKHIEGMEECNPYILCNLKRFELMLSAIRKQLENLKDVSMQHEEFILQEEGKALCVFDFTTGKRRELPVLNKKEYDEYVNHRFEVRNKSN